MYRKFSAFTHFKLPDRLKSYVLPAVVFITGACVLVIEVVATRILAPYYGNTIYTVSSILSVVLAALSIGYYVGGRLADSRPDPKLFYGIITMGGAAVLVLHVLHNTLLPYLGRHLSITTGPLVTAVALFLLPAVFLGMLSPFAIKLQQAIVRNKGIGTIAGEMFFWSTLGSIAGSLITGFVLVPLLGIDHIILWVGCLLILLGAGPLVRLVSKRHTTKFLLIIAVTVAVAISPATMAGIAAKPGDIIYRKDGVYEQLTIFDGQYDNRPTRFFQQDRSSSGAMYLDSDELVFPYTKYSSLYTLFNPGVQDAMVIGGGAYSIPKALLKDLPNAHVTVSEIEPSLYDLAQQYFRLPQTEHLTNVTDDGRRMLAANDARYDLIFSDVYYSLFSIPTHFTTQEFFQLARERLNNNGVFIANLIGNLQRQDSSLILSEMRTFQQAFPNSYFFATDSPGSAHNQNIIFVGFNSDQRIDLRSDTVTKHTNPIIASLADLEIDPARFKLSDYPILTDNFAPTEQMVASLLADKETNSPDSGQMMALIKQQLSYGPRYAGSAGHDTTINFIQAEAQAIAPNVTVQRWQEHDTTGTAYELSNIIMRIRPELQQRIVVGTHFDSKATANLDTQDPNAPVPGANDSASGVAVLLETARALANDNQLKTGIDFVFFDGEEGLPDSSVESGKWQPLGSTHFVKHLGDLYPTGNPKSGVVIDMVCDKNLTVSQELGSLYAAPSQTERFWNIGKTIAPDAFLPSMNKEIFDDHSLLNGAGIPSFVVIDMDYPPYHTADDTLDKCSSQSLSTVAHTLTRYLKEE